MTTAPARTSTGSIISRNIPTRRDSRRGRVRLSRGVASQRFSRSVFLEPVPGSPSGRRCSPIARCSCGRSRAKPARRWCAIATDLPNARVIDNGGVKDLADLHATSRRRLSRGARARIANAWPIDRLPPTVIFDPIIGDTLDRIKARKLEPIDAVPTMLPTWNAHCRDSGGGVGLARGWHVTVGAKSGRGKSLIALNLAAAAVVYGERVAFISLEMTQEQLATRFLAIMSGVTIRDLEQGPVVQHGDVVDGRAHRQRHLRRDRRLRLREPRGDLEARGRRRLDEVPSTRCTAAGT
jgi:hypothetical protein